MIPLKARQTEDIHIGCPLCRDEGLPAQVIAMDGTTGMATVETNEGRREVALDLVDDVEVGDYVLVHIDMAIAKLRPEDVSAL